MSVGLSPAGHADLMKQLADDEKVQSKDLHEVLTRPLALAVLSCTSYSSSFPAELLSLWVAETSPETAFMIGDSGFSAKISAVFSVWSTL